MAGVIVYHVGLGTDRVYIHIEVERGPAAGVWEVRYEPRSAHPGEASPGAGQVGDHAPRRGRPLRPGRGKPSFHPKAPA